MKIKVYEKCEKCGNVPCAYREGGVCKWGCYVRLVAKLKKCPGGKEREMRVLVSCEFSGTVREAFKKKGHDAWSCDLLPTDIPGNHYQRDVFDIINDGWDMMIAFPPCTHLACSGAMHFEKKRKDGRQKEGIEFFLKLTQTKIPKWAIENPVGIMSKIYRKPDQIIQPYYFGDPFQKTTCLWLHNTPPPSSIHARTICSTKRHIHTKASFLSGQQKMEEKSGSRYGTKKQKAKK